MRVTRRVKHAPLHILIDSGSTHNFLNLATAKKLHCVIKKIPPLQVGVANEQYLLCPAMCKDFSWSLLGETFTTDVMLVTLGNYDMVLGIQWLASLGPILWDFEKLRMEFKKDGRRVVLRGTQKTDMEWLGSKKLQQTMHKASQLFALQVQPVNPAVEGCSKTTVPPEVQGLLNAFEDVFEEPRSMPPHRELDHKILLKPGSLPVNVRPYRYPILQKDIIEKTVKEMLQAGLIRDSHSPYSSPIVLVKKKDGT